MKRMYTLIKAISAMLLVVIIASSCKKTTANPGDDNPGIQNKFAVYSRDSVNIGTIQFSKMANGDAKVVLSIEKPVLAQFTGPYTAMLVSSTLPSATLQPINAETGISETTPIISSNKSLSVSYDALMFMRDLRLMISDGQNNVIAFSDVH